MSEILEKEKVQTVGELIAMLKTSAERREEVGLPGNGQKRIDGNGGNPRQLYVLPSFTQKRKSSKTDLKSCVSTPGAY